MFSELVKLSVRKNKCFYFDRVFVSLLLLVAAIVIVIVIVVYLKRCQFRPDNFISGLNLRQYVVIKV